MSLSHSDIKRGCRIYHTNSSYQLVTQRTPATFNRGVVLQEWLPPFKGLERRVKVAGVLPLGE
ncbi:MAG: hypothetical protein ABJK37_02965, partial [Paraglaciecola sp.]|uniref:hypothetical protein n=1 Tax=Paraglaciecola sp. TaxID=1920173 RepID=UPI00329A1960